MPKRILVLNDSQEILQLFNDILEGEGGYEVRLLAALSTQTIDKVKEHEPDLIISDHVFGEEKIGWDVVQKIRMDRDLADVPVIICSAAVKELREMEGLLKEKNVGLLYKPFDIDELLALVKQQLGDEVVAERVAQT